MPRAEILAAIAALPVLLTGCGESSPPASANESTGAPQAAREGVVVDTYTVRGIVTSVPSDDNPMSGFQARHEAIPGFRSQGGEVGMNVMNMAFPLVEGVDLGGIGVDDIVSITFTVDYDEVNDRLLGFRATSIERLPDGTELDFTPLSTPE